MNNPAGPEMPKAARTAFDFAAASYAGLTVEPLAYLGSQVVAGINYAYLCRVTPVIPDGVSALQTAVVYARPDGTAQFLRFRAFDLSRLRSAAAEPSSDRPGKVLAGGWTVYAGRQAAVLPEEVQEAFDKTAGTLSGTSHIPLAYLGSQNGGMIHAVLTEDAPSVFGQPKAGLSVAFLSAPTDGEYRVSFAALDLGSLVK